MFKAYDTILKRRPVLVQSATTAGLFLIGDFVAQQVVEKKGISNHDLARSGRLVLFGGCVAGPGVALWYPVLQRLVTIRNTSAALVTRVFLDQTIFAPTFIGLFFSFNTLMEGKGIKGVKTRLEKGYLPALYDNWKVWPAFQLVNFAFIPLLYRSLAVNGVATMWNSYLSVLNARLNSIDDAEKTINVVD